MRLALIYSTLMHRAFAIAAKSNHLFGCFPSYPKPSAEDHYNAGQLHRRMALEVIIVCSVCSYVKKLYVCCLFGVLVLLLLIGSSMISFWEYVSFA